MRTNEPAMIDLLSIDDIAPIGEELTEKELALVSGAQRLIDLGPSCIDGEYYGKDYVVVD